MASTTAPVRIHHRVALAVVGVVLLFVAVLVPFAIGSVVTDVVSPQSHHVFQLTGTGPAGDSVTYANVDVVGVDEWMGLVTLRVTGQHLCSGSCTWNDRLTFVSIPDSFASGQGLPPAQEIVFPSARAQPVNQTIQLPVYGEPVYYPFDSYHFRLGVLVLHESADGSSTPAPPDQQESTGQQLFVSLRMQAPRQEVSSPKTAVVPRLTGTSRQLPSLLAADMQFSRPRYLQVLAVLLVLLAAAAAAYAVFLRPLDEIVINSGALVLGVWGIRAILLGTNVPGFTSVDLALSIVILFLLVAITTRALLYLWMRVRGGNGAPGHKSDEQT